MIQVTDQSVIEQLSEYRQKKARIHSLSSYSVGGGITVSRLNEDDQLQELHRKLRNLPSYMYLNKHEQKLEQTAHAYLTRYPSGIKSQLRAFPRTGVDAEDEKMLREIRSKIKKIMAARGYDVADNVDEVIERLTELQDLKAEVERIETVLEALESYQPDYARLIRKHIIDGEAWESVAEEMSLSKAVFYRWRKRAITEFEKLAK